MIETQTPNVNEIERIQYIQWLPQLLTEKIDKLSVTQLKLLHFILGYDSSIMTEDDFLDYTVEFLDNDTEARKIWDSLNKQGVLMMKSPYPID